MDEQLQRSPARRREAKQEHSESARSTHLLPDLLSASVAERFRRLVPLGDDKDVRHKGPRARAQTQYTRHPASSTRKRR